MGGFRWCRIPSAPAHGGCVAGGCATPACAGAYCRAEALPSGSKSARNNLETAGTNHADPGQKGVLLKKELMVVFGFTIVFWKWTCFYQNYVSGGAFATMS